MRDKQIKTIIVPITNFVENVSYLRGCGVDICVSAFLDPKPSYVYINLDTLTAYEWTDSHVDWRNETKVLEKIEEFHIEYVKWKLLNA